MNRAKRELWKVFCLLFVVVFFCIIESLISYAADINEWDRNVNSYVEDISTRTSNGSVVRNIDFDPQIAHYYLTITDAQNLMFNITKSDNNISRELYAAFYIDNVPVDITGSTIEDRYTYQIPLSTVTKVLPSSMVVKKWCLVGETHVLTIRVGEREDITTVKRPDNFIKADSYHFHISTVPGLSKMSVDDGNGQSIVLSPSLEEHYGEDTFLAITQTDRIKLNLTPKSEETNIQIGEEKYDSEKIYDLSIFEKTVDKNASIIPIHLSYETEEGICRRQCTLYVSKEDYRPEIIEQSEADTILDGKGNTSIFVKTNRSERGELSFQWFNCSDYSVKLINGATERVFYPTYEGKYQCVITNVVNGIPYITKSEYINCQLDNSILRAPDFIVQPYVSVAEKIYYIGNAPTIYTELEAINGNYIQNIEYNVEVFRATTPSLEDGVKLGNAIKGIGSHGIRYSFSLQNETKKGDFYYYFKVTVSKLNEESMTNISQCFYCTFKESNDIVTALNGSGSASDPFKINDENDLIYVKDLVEGTNLSGKNPDNDIYAFEGQTLKFTKNIILSTNWEPIGAVVPGGPLSRGESGDGRDLLPFSGIIDGNGNTLVIADHGKPLLNFVRRAKICNMSLEGNHIDGYGFVNKYTVDYQPEGYLGDWIKHRLVDFENVTIKSGTQILKSGFIGGEASGENAVNIKKCIIEKGVVIGYDKTQSHIGSFAGEFNGTITDSVSYADVYGVDFVGGLIGNKGQSIGPCDMINSSFQGTVTASGDSIGGIVGSGYMFAVGTPLVKIQNCLVDATLVGNDKIGGIIGDESGKVNYSEKGDEYGEKGALALSDNFFYGKIISSGSNVGGIIGYLNDFEKDTGEASNFFLEGCGAARGIGGAKTGEIIGEEKHSASATVEEFADGTVVNKLNNSPTSYRNWIQGEKYPIFTDEPIIISLSLAGNYKTEYYLGDEIDLTGMEITANWNNGDVTALQTADVDVSGYDPGTRGKQTITVKLKEGAAKADFDITILKKQEEGKEIEVSFTLLGDKRHDSDTDGEIHSLSKDNLIEWIAEDNYTVDINATVKDVFEQACTEHGLTWKNPTGNYVESVTYNEVTIGEFTNGKDSGWMYTLNGSHSALGVSEQFLEDGDIIIFHYSDMYTEEKDADKWKEDMSQKLEELTNQINALPDPDKLTLSEDDQEAVADAVAAYEALNDGEKKLVPAEVKERLEKVKAKLAELKKAASGETKPVSGGTGNSSAGKPSTGGTGSTGTPKPSAGSSGSTTASKPSTGGTGNTTAAKPSSTTRQSSATTAVKPVGLTAVKNLGITSNTAGKKLTLKFSKVKGATSYRIAYKLNNAKTWRYATAAKNSYVFKKVKKNGTLIVKVQAAAKSGSKTTYGAYSKVNYFLQNKASLKKAATGKKLAKVSWKKQTGITGYQISYSLNKNFSKSSTKLVKGPKKTALTVKKLKSKKKYFFRIRPYKTVKGKKYFGAWSSIRAAKVK